MKKHLIAAAVAAAVAVPAMAQVSISGRIDTSFANVDKNSSSTGQDFILSDLLTSNQLVISGSEDLGGGLKASFSIITPFASDSNTNTLSTSSGFNFGGRGMIVGVSGGFGSIDIGRSPGSMANSVMASGVTGNIGNLGALNARPNNSISYTTPAFNGVTARVLHSLGDETAADTSKLEYQELSAEYKNKALLVRVFQGKQQGAIGGNDSTERGAQFNYDLGMAMFNARYIKLDEDGGVTNDTKRLGFGVSVPLGNGFTAAIDRLSKDGDSTADYDTTSVTVVKALSKRTNVYVAYARTTNDATSSQGAFGGTYSSSSYVIGGTVPSASSNGVDPTGYAIGVRHSF